MYKQQSVEKNESVLIDLIAHQTRNRHRHVLIVVKLSIYVM